MICSQNLKRYGIEKMPTEKTIALVQGFIRVGCEIIAVQELRADNLEQSRLVLQQLSSELLLQSDRAYEVFSGKSNDRYLKLGFLVAKDRLYSANIFSYSDELLPKFLLHQPQRLFVRGPLELELQILNRDTRQIKSLVLVNFHLKSRHNFPRDPAGLSWESYRMEAAAGLRKIVSARQARNLQNNINPVLLLGDRNSERESASAKILNGSLELRDLFSGRLCKISKEGIPHCVKPAYRDAQFFSVLDYNPFLPDSPGTFKRGSADLWIDDILLAVSFLRTGSETVRGRRVVSGVYQVSPVASDHNLIYAFLDW